MQKRQKGKHIFNAGPSLSCLYLRGRFLAILLFLLSAPFQVHYSVPALGGEHLHTHVHSHTSGEAGPHSHMHEQAHCEATRGAMLGFAAQEDKACSHEHPENCHVGAATLVVVDLGLLALKPGFEPLRLPPAGPSRSYPIEEPPTGLVL